MNDTTAKPVHATELIGQIDDAGNFTVNGSMELLQTLVDNPDLLQQMQVDALARREAQLAARAAVPDNSTPPRVLLDPIARVDAILATLVAQQVAASESLFALRGALDGLSKYMATVSPPPNGAA